MTVELRQIRLWSTQIALSDTYFIKLVHVVRDEIDYLSYFLVVER